MNTRLVDSYSAITSVVYLVSLKVPCRISDIHDYGGGTNDGLYANHVKLDLGKLVFHTEATYLKYDYTHYIYCPSFSN